MRIILFLLRIQSRDIQIKKINLLFLKSNLDRSVYKMIWLIELNRH